jgi:hypothetical protein
MTKFCPRCGWPMLRGRHRWHASGRQHERRQSIDHILPICRGGATDMGDTIMTEIMCQECNGKRGKCFHCWALVACIQDVAANERMPFDVIYRQWRIGWHRTIPKTPRRELIVSAMETLADEDDDQLGQVGAVA